MKISYCLVENTLEGCLAFFQHDICLSSIMLLSSCSMQVMMFSSNVLMLQYCCSLQFFLWFQGCLLWYTNSQPICSYVVSGPLIRCRYCSWLRPFQLSVLWLHVQCNQGCVQKFFGISAHLVDSTDQLTKLVVFWWQTCNPCFPVLEYIRDISILGRLELYQYPTISVGD